MHISEKSTLIAPYGNTLVDPVIPLEAFEERKAYAGRLPSIQISSRSLADLELLAAGALSPIDRFMGSHDYQRVLEEMRLADGTIFPMPVSLAVEDSPGLHLDRDIALRSSKNELLGIMTIYEIYRWDRGEFARRILGENNTGQAELQQWGALNLSGPLQILKNPGHYDFKEYRLTPAQTRARLAGMGNPRVAAFHPPDALAGVDAGLLAAAVDGFDGVLLLQLADSAARPGDMAYYTRMRIYTALAERCAGPDRILISLLPRSSHGIEVRETLWQALIGRNYGAGHLLTRFGHGRPARPVDRGTIARQRDSVDLLMNLGRELGVTILPVREDAEAQPGQPEGTSAAYTTPEAGRRPRVRSQIGACIQRTAAEIQAETLPPRHQQGVCIWFTGLSGAGKSTTAEIVTSLLMEYGRQVTVLDGDVVRTHLSKGLGFSKEDRDTNVRRIGFVAAELVRIGGVVVCAVVSPYRAARGAVRNMMEPGHFIEVFVDTPLEICEARDVKGMYARARRGELNGFTGIDDPYEPPQHPEIRLDTIGYTPEENARRILAYLGEQGFISDEHMLKFQQKRIAE